MASKIIREIAARKKPGEPVNILTHCNAGWLATVDYGTATAPVYLATEAGIPVHVFVDETRPRNQGAQLTAWEMAGHGVPHTLIVDNAGGHLMQHGEIDMVIVGTDRTTANGDVCNKIGTYLKALAASDNGVPFYVALPSPTIDWTVGDGVKEIPIEERSGEEVSLVWGKTGEWRDRTSTRVAGRHACPQSGFRRHPCPTGHRPDHRARRGKSFARRSCGAVSRSPPAKRYCLTYRQMQIVMKLIGTIRCVCAKKTHNVIAYRNNSPRLGSESPRFSTVNKPLTHPVPADRRIGTGVASYCCGATTSSEVLDMRGFQTTIKSVFAAGALVAGLMAAPAWAQEDTIKVGILHSLSGTMAISETTLKDTMLFLIDEQNKKGGLLGKKLEAVVVDPASDWPLFAEKARELIEKDKVAAVFGCWTSVSRKSVLPVFEELNNLLFYPVQYEGEESQRNVFYTGAAPNQQAIPAVDYLMSEDGGSVKRWVLAGTDYVYPQTTNKILQAYLESKGVAKEDIMVNYTPFGHSDWQTIVTDIKNFGSAGKKTAVVSTINGDANVPFYKELANQGIKAEDIPVVAFSVGEEELAGLDTGPLVGHLTAWNYFQSVDTPENADFIEEWKAYTKNDKRVTNDPMEAHVIGFNMWVKAVEKAGTTDPDAVIDAIVGVSVPNLSGGFSTMMPNHHITKPVLIGEIQDDGQMETVWQTSGLVVGDEWSDYLPDSKDLISDWREPMSCGNFNVATGKCGGKGVNYGPDLATIVSCRRTARILQATRMPRAGFLSARGVSPEEQLRVECCAYLPLRL